MLIQPFFKLLNKVCKNICEVYKCYLSVKILSPLTINVTYFYLFLIILIQTVSESYLVICLKGKSYE